MADARITDLASIDAANVQPGVDVLALADVSASETKKITAADVVRSGVVDVSDGSIPGSKIEPGSIGTIELEDGGVGAIDLADNAVTTSKIDDKAVTAAKIADDTITADQIAPNAIGNSELADNSVATAKIQDSAVTTVKIDDAAITSNKLAIGAVDSAAIADGGINTVDLADDAVSTPKISDGSVTSSKLAVGAVDNASIGASAVTGDKIAVGTIPAVALAGDMNGSEFLPQSPNVVLAGPALAPSATPTFRSLTSNDLPAIPASNLPIASDTDLGIVQSGTGLSISAGGIIRISNTIVASTGTKVTYDGNGLITASTTLDATDIPDLDASKLTSGSLDIARIADRSITKELLANYSISYIQEANPGIATTAHIGMLWYQESTAGLHMWNGNSWMPVSIGRLSQENLRYCGVIDATTGLITGVTSFGTSAGYVIGDSLGNATDARTGVYFVVVVPGSAIPETPGVTYDNGDWVLCNGAAAGWLRVDTLSSGGGGGGAQNFGDLLDVTLTSPSGNSLVALDSGTSQWVNVQTISLTGDITTTGDLGSTDLTLTGKGTSAATTGTDPAETLTTKGYVDTAIATNVPASATETVAGIAEIATTDEVTAGTDDSRIVSPLKLKEALDALPPGTTVSITAPTNPDLGQAWFDTSSSTFKIWDGTAWKPTEPPLWNRAGTILSPANADDDITTTGNLGGDALALTGKGTSAVTVAGDSGTTLTTKGYVDTLVGATSLNDLTDVTLTTPAEHSILSLNGAGQWVNTLDVDGGENYGQ